MPAPEPNARRSLLPSLLAASHRFGGWIRVQKAASEQYPASCAELVQLPRTGSVRARWAAATGSYRKVLVEVAVPVALLGEATRTPGADGGGSGYGFDG